MLSFSNDIAIEFDKKDLMSFFSSSLVFFGCFVRIFNTRFLLKIKHKYKNWVTIVIWANSIILLIVGKYTKLFGLTIVASICVGIGTSLGDCTIIGFMKCFPPKIISGYSSGTGMSGIIGAALYLLFKLFNVSFLTTVLSLLVFYPVYGVCFLLVIRMKLNMHKTTQSLILNKQEQGPKETDIVDAELESNASIPAENDKQQQEELEKNESAINAPLTWQNFVRVFLKAWGLFLSFGLLYFLEYIAITSISSQIAEKYKNNYAPDKVPRIVSVLFETLQLAYQCGIFLSRSSLDLIQIKKIWLILTFLFAFSGLSFVQSVIHATPGIWLPIITIFLLGFTGGFGYANIFHQVLKNKKIDKSERELSININGMASDLGIIFSSLIGYFFSFMWKKIN